METCAECGKPIKAGEPSYYAKRPSEDIGDTYHSTCGDPFGIKSAVAAERERCAAIASRFDWYSAGQPKNVGPIVINEIGEKIAAEIQRG